MLGCVWRTNLRVLVEEITYIVRNDLCIKFLGKNTRKVSKGEPTLEIIVEKNDAISNGDA